MSQKCENQYSSAKKTAQIKKELRNKEIEYRFGTIRKKMVYSQKQR